MTARPAVRIPTPPTQPNLAANLGKPPRKPVVSNAAGSLEMPLLTILVAAVLFYGWLQRDEGHLTAETGLGYYLGIIGSVLMLALLLYPLRKRLRALRFVGSVRAWFRIHMLLGVIGPALVLLHSNFTLGSLNSTVALTAMLIVAGSGFAGRFFYARIHRGLYGHKLNVNELIAQASEIKEYFGSEGNFSGEISQEITQYQNVRLDSNNRFWKLLLNMLNGPFSRKKLTAKLNQRAKASLKTAGISFGNRRKEIKLFNRNLDKFFRSLARAEAFTVYERLFSLWHLLHLPLFVILVLAALVHVLAVHLF